MASQQAFPMITKNEETDKENSSPEIIRKSRSSATPSPSTQARAYGRRNRFRFAFSPQDIQTASPKVTDWRIPRPLLYTGSSRTDSSTYTSNYERNIRTIYGLEAEKPEKLDQVPIHIPNEAKWFSSGSSSSSSSRTASSGSLLLSPSNLNSLKHEQITVKAADTQSIASSTHFTLINGITIPKKHISTCCSRSRQLSVLVITMTIILFFGILGAILFVELRAMELRHP